MQGVRDGGVLTYIHSIAGRKPSNKSFGTGTSMYTDPLVKLLPCKREGI